MPVGQRDVWVERSAGERNKEVRVEQLTEANDNGTVVGTWSTLIETVWMHRRDAAGTERYMHSQVAARFDSEWSMPYVASMDPELVDVPKARRLSYQGRTHQIIAAVLGDRRSEIVLLTIASSRVS